MADSVHGKLIDATVSAIEGLNLSGVADANVLGQAVAEGKESATSGVSNYPAIVVSPVNRETIPPLGGTNKRDEVTYPVQVAIVDAANRSQSLTQLDTWLKYREDLIDHFIHNRVSITGNHRVSDQTIVPGPIVEPNAWREKDLFVSMFMIEFKLWRERRPS